MNETGKRRRLKLSPATVIATIALIFAVTGVAKSAIPDENGYYVGCYYIDADPDFSYMYLIDPPGTCDTGLGEKLITWSQYGAEATKLALAKENAVSAEGSLKDVRDRIDAKKFLDSIESISLKGIKFKAKPFVKSVKKDDFKGLAKQVSGIEKAFKGQSKFNKQLLKALEGGEKENLQVMREMIDNILGEFNKSAKKIIESLEGGAAP